MIYFIFLNKMLNLIQKKIELVYSMNYFVYDLVSNNETLLKYFTMFPQPQSRFGKRSPSFYLALESLFCSSAICRLTERVHVLTEDYLFLITTLKRKSHTLYEKHFTFIKK